MSPIRTTPCALVILTACLLAVGLWQIGEGSWIYAKAGLAQFLLQRAWLRTLAGEPTVKPWPWADTWPVARLRVPSRGIDVIVLNGAYGRTLAFGPGYAESSSFPGSPGTTILTGHRDTHFEFLRRLKQDEEIVLETAEGVTQRYLVRDSQIVDARTASIDLTDGGDQLVLVTCYPFDAVSSGSPLRYLIRAIRVPSAHPSLQRAASRGDCKGRRRLRRRSGDQAATEPLDRLVLACRRGRIRRNVVPLPTMLWTSMWPLWTSTTSLMIFVPSPVPPGFRLRA